MKKSLLIFVVGIMMVVLAGCKNSPTGPGPGTVFDPTPVPTNVVSSNATATFTVVVNIATATVTQTSTSETIATATATSTSTDVPAANTATATATITATSSLSQYYVTVASLSSTESSFTAYVGPTDFINGYTENAYSIQAPAPYYYVFTSDVVNTNSFHLEGVCATQAVRVRAYKNGVAFWGVDVSANTHFGVNY